MAVTATPSSAASTNRVRALTPAIESKRRVPRLVRARLRRAWSAAISYGNDSLETNMRQLSLLLLWSAALSVLASPSAGSGGAPPTLNAGQPIHEAARGRFEPAGPAHPALVQLESGFTLE